MQQIAVETADAQQRIGQIDDQKAVEVETGGESAHGGRFAGANLAGQPADTALAHEVGQARSEFLLVWPFGRGRLRRPQTTLGGGDEQVFGGDGLGKG